MTNNCKIVKQYFAIITNKRIKRVGFILLFVFFLVWGGE